MTKDEYILIKNDNNKDLMPLYFYYFNLKTKKQLSFNEFYQPFSIWIVKIITIFRVPQLQDYIFNELDKHFEIQ